MKINKRSMKRYAVIVAGGSGKRMGTDIPKQFIKIKGRPVLMHTIEAFRRFDKSINIIVVLPQAQTAWWKDLCKKHEFDILHETVTGGETRYHSVKNGLTAIEGDCIIGVHDGVRPFVSVKTLENTYVSAEENGNAVPVIDAFESIRLLTGNGNKAIERSMVKFVQTPQVFRSDQIFKAYEIPYRKEFTDDASVVEYAGFKINLVEGNRDNIKITTPLDLKLAELLHS